MKNLCNEKDDIAILCDNTFWKQSTLDDIFKQTEIEHHSTIAHQCMSASLQHPDPRGVIQVWDIHSGNALYNNSRSFVSIQQ